MGEFAFLGVPLLVYYFVFSSSQLAMYINMSIDFYEFHVRIRYLIDAVYSRNMKQSCHKAMFLLHKTRSYM